jgi:uncharacterized protein
MHAPLQTSRAVALRREILSGIWLDARLGLWLARERLLVLADLHWGYSASHRARGNLLPWWGDDELEQRIRALLTDYQPAEMLWLGDAVHAADGAAAAERFLQSCPVPVTVLAGNHDRGWDLATTRTATRGRFFFHHGDLSQRVPAGGLEVIGHHHPSVTWNDGAGGNIKVPALVATGQRLVLPAFSPWAAGAPWIQPLGPGDTVWAIAPTRIFPVPPRSAE